MIHQIYRVTSFKIIGPYALSMTFDDGTEQIINFEPVLAGELYKPLRDLTLFNAVQIDPEVHTLVWPNGADFDPETLHDWPKLAEGLIARARQWELAAAQAA
jgi:hypothetical protein